MPHRRTELCQGSWNRTLLELRIIQRNRFGEDVGCGQPRPSPDRTQVIHCAAQHASLRPRIQQFVTECRILMRDILKARVEKLTLGRPSLREVSDQPMVDARGTRSIRLLSELRPEGPDRVASGAELQVAQGRAARIHFNEVSCAGSLFDHEVQSEEAGQAKPSREAFGGAKHQRTLHEATHNGRPFGAIGAENLDGQSGQDPALPSYDSTIRGTPVNANLTDHLKWVRVAAR